MAREIAGPSASLRRRTTLRWLAAAAPTSLVASQADAQDPGRVARIGLLTNISLRNRFFWELFDRELASSGWSRERNLIVDVREVDGRTASEQSLAEELLAARPEVLVATSSSAAIALRNATRSIPIVMMTVSYPVELGLIATEARPGGNVTGAIHGPALGKRVEMLKAVTPGLHRLGVFWDPGNPASALSLRDTVAATSKVGVKTIALRVEPGAQPDDAQALALRERVQAILVHPTVRRGNLPVWAIEHRLPSHGYVEQGYLFWYWSRLDEQARIAAGYVNKILRGASPAELPVQWPTRYTLRLNMNTARALNIQVPRAWLLMVDHVVE